MLCVDVRSLCGRDAVAAALHIFLRLSLRRGRFYVLKANWKAIVISGVQAYLDLYARGGRDLKQAEFLLRESIQSLWGAA